MSASPTTITATGVMLQGASMKLFELAAANVRTDVDQNVALLAARKACRDTIEALEILLRMLPDAVVRNARGEKP